MLPLFAVILIVTKCSSFELDFVPVIVDSGPSIVSFRSGDTMVLSCIVKGYPTPAAQIVKLSEDSNETGDDDQWKLLDMALDFVSNVVGDSVIEVTLTQRVTLRDSGWYRCKSENIHGRSHADTFVEVTESLSSALSYQYMTEEWGTGTTEEWPTDITEDWVTDYTEESATDITEQWTTDPAEWQTYEYETDVWAADGTEEYGTDEWATGSTGEWVDDEWETVWVTEWVTESEWLTDSTDEWNTESSEKWVSGTDEMMSWTDEWTTESDEDWDNGVWQKTEWGTGEYETEEMVTDEKKTEAFKTVGTEAWGTDPTDWNPVEEWIDEEYDTWETTSKTPNYRKLLRVLKSK